MKERKKEGDELNNERASSLKARIRMVVVSKSGENKIVECFRCFVGSSAPSARLTQMVAVGCW